MEVEVRKGGLWAGLARWDADHRLGGARVEAAGALAAVAAGALGAPAADPEVAAAALEAELVSAAHLFAVAAVERVDLGIYAAVALERVAETLLDADAF